ncbi:S1 family peptidase [Methylobacterium sp. E-025]|uniref:S1 family peptidase n=1 Tax=unclassified Methylobacterium TaxID=2615210 RepID=UPI001FBB1DB2|nr:MULTISPECIES: S1 family peptidase [unclassified Methylobacterium]MCJ2008405.1 S1 family peptidase [Methylobacterium sp. J-092]MCJ2113614.1 S1 family peptidase [Methylobacterium sp. E-025]
MVFGQRVPRPAAIGLAWLATLAWAGGPAHAVIGGAEATPEGAVMVLSSKGGVCSAVVVAPDTVLTAGHCAGAGLEHRIHFRDASGQPVLVEVAARAVHPGYDAGAIAGRRRSIDLALLRTATPLPPRFSPATFSTASPRAGETLTLAGYGAERPGDPRSTGTFRSVALPVIEPYGPSRILVWLKAAGRAGGCQGDSGGPVSDAAGVVAVTAWIGGACGGLTQAVRVAPQRDWLDRTLAGWDRTARWH